MADSRSTVDQAAATGSGRAGHSSWFVFITCLFITCLITANIISVKLIHVFGWVLPAGVIIFPVSYITADILTEVYGYAQACQEKNPTTPKINTQT